MPELNPENEIKEVTFDFEGAHLALCHKTQGYSANQKPMPLLVKGEEVEVTDEAKEAIEKVMGDQNEVQVTTSLFDFLRKWYNLYWDDADTLARILGYSGDGLTASEWVEEQIGGVKLLKSKEIFELSEQSQEDLKELVKFVESNDIDFEKNSFSEGNSEMNDGKEVDSQKPSENNLNKNQEELMPDDIKKLEKAQADLEALQAQVAELQKAADEEKSEKEALSAKVASFEKAAQERKEKLFTKAVEDYSFITPDDKEGFVKTLIELDEKDGEMAEAIVAVLDKAQDAVNAVDGAQGSDSSEELEVVKSSSLQEKLLAKYGDKD